MAISVRFAESSRFNADRNDATARRLFLATITYLPLLWIAMVADKL